MTFNPDLAEHIASGLSAQEIALIPIHLTRPAPCVGEFDAQIKIDCGPSIPCSIRVYGRSQPGFAGSRETPEEPAYIEVSSVTINAGGVETEIYSAMAEKHIDALAELAEEA